MSTRFILLAALVVILAGLLALPMRAAPVSRPVAQQPWRERLFIPVVTSAPPIKLRVLSHRTDTSYGFRRILGEVINESTVPVYAIELEATLYNSSNHVLATAPGYVFLEETRPGQRTPFEIHSDVMRGVARTEVRIAGWQTTPHVAVQPLQVASQQRRDNMGGLEFFGELTNASTAVLRSPLVVATLYDGTGNVVDVHVGGTVVDTLRPGDRAIYQILGSSNFSRVLIQAEARVAPPGTLAPPMRLLSHRTYSEPGYHYIVGEAINDGMIPAFRVAIEARFYNAANQLVAVSGGAGGLLGFGGPGNIFGGPGGLLGRTAPGQRTPFILELINAPSGIVRTDLRVSASPDTPEEIDYRSLTVVSQQVRNAADRGIEVYGVLRNDHSVAVHMPIVVVTFRDSTGKVVEVAWGWGEADMLEPAARANYVAGMPNTITYASYTVQAEGVILPNYPEKQHVTPATNRPHVLPEVWQHPARARGDTGGNP